METNMYYKSKIAQRVSDSQDDIINDYVALELVRHHPNPSEIGSMQLYEHIEQVKRVYKRLKIPAELIHVIRAVATAPEKTDDKIIDFIMENIIHE